jgi:hypothetical protein
MTPIVQLPLPLWTDHDPNLNRLGIYEFCLDAEKLAKVVLRLTLPKMASKICIIELSQIAFRGSTTTTDLTFGVAQTVPLSRTAELGDEPVQFAIDLPFLTRFASGFQGEIFFKFDRNTSTLSWIQDQMHGQYSLSSTSKPSWVRVSQGPTTNLSSVELKKAIRFVSTFLKRKNSRIGQPDGVCFHNGSITSGYVNAVSRYQSLSLPNSLSLTVPQCHATNIDAVVTGLSGEVQLNETESKVFVKSQHDSMEAYWTKGGFWPTDLDQVFDRNPLATFIIDRLTFAARLGLISSLSIEDVRIAPSIEGSKAALDMTGSSKIALFESREIANLLGTANSPIDGWDYKVRAKDLEQAVMAMPGADIKLSILDCGLLLSTFESGDRAQTLLVASDRD